MPRCVLVYRIGSLGDTLVAVPALRALRRHFAGDRLTLLCDRQVGRSYVLAADLLEATHLVDDFLVYPFDPSPAGRLARPFHLARLFLEIRRRRFDAMVYLAPSNRDPVAVARDRHFFAAAGISDVMGFNGFRSAPTRTADGLETVSREADRLLARLAQDGVEAPALGRADHTLEAGPKHLRELDAWIPLQPGDGGRRWISIGPGGKQPVNRWPIERYEAVVQKLLCRYDVWPIVFGGQQDAEDGRRLVASWRRGWNAAGSLSPRSAMAAMSRCAFHLGNDTGTMHMAAAAGTRCVGVYSSRHLPGWWYPYGEGHTIFRTPIECENCGLFVCTDRAMECILTIDVDAVVRACESILAEFALPRT